MLYDPKWQNTTTKPDVFSLKSLIAWLEKQPADRVYCYGQRGTCLAAQFNIYCGRTYPNPYFGPLPWTPFDATLEEIAQEGERTFGAALDRARKAVTA